MSANPLASVITGSLFGSALLVSGVYSPSVITSQLDLTNHHMLQVFLTASASSAILMTIAKQTKIVACPPRKPSNLNRLYQYDGNIIGGLLLGSGMALTGACPGTVLVQIATGVSSGVVVLVGGVLGGILWSRFGKYATRTRIILPPTDDGQDNKVEEKHTVYESLNMCETKAVLVYELVCLSMIASALYLSPPSANSPNLHPIVGGLLIGAAQGASLLITGAAIGVSTGYETIGNYICRLTGLLPFRDTPWPSPNSVIFALAMLCGSWGVKEVLNWGVMKETINISAAQAVLGGVLLVIGGRTAGGCTSGHGISGMALLSKSSFVTVVAMFAGGIGLTKLLPLFA